MRSLKYLNTILTLIAILLTLNLWTQWTDSPLTLDREASAQTRTTTAAPPAPPNAAAQRGQTNEQLQQLNAQMERLNAMFRDGTARVRVDVPNENR